MRKWELWTIASLDCQVFKQSHMTPAGSKPAFSLKNRDSKAVWIKPLLPEWQLATSACLSSLLFVNKVWRGWHERSQFLHQLSLHHQTCRAQQMDISALLSPRARPSRAGPSARGWCWISHSRASGLLWWTGRWRWRWRVTAVCWCRTRRARLFTVHICRPSSLMEYTLTAESSTPGALRRLHRTKKNGRFMPQ